MSISDQLASSRKSRKWTQAQLAGAAGLSRMTVQRIESGDIDPRVSTLLEMARALDLEWLLVPGDLKAEVEAFLQSSGRVLGQPAGAGAPLSVVQALLKAAP